MTDMPKHHRSSSGGDARSKEYMYLCLIRTVERKWVRVAARSEDEAETLAVAGVVRRRADAFDPAGTCGFCVNVEEVEEVGPLSGPLRNQ